MIDTPLCPWDGSRMRQFKTGLWTCDLCTRVVLEEQWIELLTMEELLGLDILA